MRIFFYSFVVFVCLFVCRRCHKAKHTRYIYLLYLYDFVAVVRLEQMSPSRHIDGNSIFDMVVVLLYLVHSFYIFVVGVAKMENDRGKKYIVYHIYINNNNNNNNDTRMWIPHSTERQGKKACFVVLMSFRARAKCNGTNLL